MFYPIYFSTIKYNGNFSIIIANPSVINSEQPERTSTQLFHFNSKALQIYLCTGIPSEDARRGSPIESDQHKKIEEINKCIK